MKPDASNEARNAAETRNLSISNGAGQLIVIPWAVLDSDKLVFVYILGRHVDDAGQTSLVVGFPACLISSSISILYGRTTLSVTGVEVVGKSTNDLAIAVTLEAQTTKQLWFAEEVLEFVDHGAGTIVETHGRKLIRDEHGSWREVKPN